MAIIRVGDKATAPSVRPSLLLDFANSKSLDPRFSFTRSSTATYYDGESTVKAEENLFLYSQGFTQNPSGYGWDKVGVTVTANTTTAPDSTTSADTISAGTTTDYHNINQDFNFSFVDDVWTFSIFMKAGSTNYAHIYPTTGSVITVDLFNGNISQTDSSITANVYTYQDGWYRVTATFTSSNAAGQVYIGPAGGNNKTISYTGSNETIHVWGAQLEHRDTAGQYIETTSSVIRKFQPKLQTTSSNTPRFDHDPVTGESKGLLIEDSRTNYQPNSVGFADYTGEAGNTRLHLNAAIAPDGSHTAAEFVEGNTNSQHTRFDTEIPSFVGSGGNWTYSVFAKLGIGPAKKLASRIYGTGNNDVYVEYDLENGTTSINTSSNVATDNYGMYSVGNGWWRCWVSFTPPGDQDGWLLGITDGSAGELPLYTGTGSSIYIWGAQLEGNHYPSSYIPTSGGTATRSAEIARINDVQNQDWYVNGKGTSFVEAAVGGFVTSQGFASFWENNNGNDWHGFYSNTPGGNGTAAYTANAYSARYVNIGSAPSGTSSATAGKSNYLPGEFARMAHSWSSTNAISAFDGYTHVNTGDYIVTPHTTFSLDQLYETGFPARQVHIKKYAFYPEALDVDELEALTEE